VDAPLRRGLGGTWVPENHFKKRLTPHFHPITPIDAGPAHAPAMSEPSDHAAAGRRTPLRFVWQMDAEHRFTVRSDEFIALMGATNAAALGQPWSEVAAALSLDPDGEIALALASRETWSGLSVAWPVKDGAERVAVELSGLPVFDRERAFRGYRGLGVCRDLARPLAVTAGASAASPGPNVVPLRPIGPPAAPALSAHERSAFHELTRQLHARLTAATGAPLTAPAAPRSGPATAARELSQRLRESIVSAEDAGTDSAAALARAQAEIAELKSQLATMQRRVETTASARADFVARISHEIRNPLNAIVGFSEVMAQEQFGPLGNARYRQYVGDIRRSGEQLLALVGDLVDLSRAEAGKLELDIAGVALNPLTQECVALAHPQAKRARVIIRTALSPRLPMVRADARTLRQIVLNLIASSTELAGAGGQVIVSTTAADSGAVTLRLRDSGSGMSDSEIERALEPFRQAWTAGRRGAARAGLCLPLAKAMSEANGALFGIRSAPPAGTLIEVTFRPGGFPPGGAVRPEMP
jgi:signal transduction histidine kinase